MLSSVRALLFAHGRGCLCVVTCEADLLMSMPKACDQHVSFMSFVCKTLCSTDCSRDPWVVGSKTLCSLIVGMYSK